MAFRYELDNNGVIFSGNGCGTAKVESCCLSDHYLLKIDRLFSRFTFNSQPLAQGGYALGAKEVIAVQIRTARKPTKCKRTGKLVVTLPENPRERQALLEWCEAQGESLGYTPESDHGESHLFLLLD
jgi:hypothetical protein